MRLESGATEGDSSKALDASPEKKENKRNEAEGKSSPLIEPRRCIEPNRKQLEPTVQLLLVGLYATSRSDGSEDLS